MVSHITVLSIQASAIHNAPTDDIECAKSFTSRLLDHLRSTNIGGESPSGEKSTSLLDDLKSLEKQDAIFLLHFAAKKRLHKAPIYAYLAIILGIEGETFITHFNITKSKFYYYRPLIEVYPIHAWIYIIKGNPRAIDYRVGLFGSLGRDWCPKVINRTIIALYEDDDKELGKLHANHWLEKRRCLEFAAKLGSIRCFRYLMINGFNMSNIGPALKGGNEEIIRMCEERNISAEGVFHKASSGDIMRWVINQYPESYKKCRTYKLIEKGDLFSFIVLNNDVPVDFSTTWFSNMKESEKLVKFPGFLHFLIQHKYPLWAFLINSERAQIAFDSGFSSETIIANINVNLPSSTIVDCLRGLNARQSLRELERFGLLFRIIKDEEGVQFLKDVIPKDACDKYEQTLDSYVPQHLMSLFEQ